jgi:hypothetical protein
MRAVRVRLVMFAVIFAACGSPSRATRSGPDGDAGGRRLQVVEDLAARACACTDRDCAAAVDEELARAIVATPAPRLFEDGATAQRVDAAAQRTVGCMWARRHVGYGFEPMVFETAEAFRHKACACELTGCKLELSRDERFRADLLRTLPVHDARHDELEGILKATRQCWQRDAAPRPDSELGEAALRSVEAWSAAVCACKDRPCMAALAPEGEAWVRRHYTVEFSPREAERLATISAAAQACMVAP